MLTQTKQSRQKTLPQGYISILVPECHISLAHRIISQQSYSEHIHIVCNPLNKLNSSSA